MLAMRRIAISVGLIVCGLIVSGAGQSLAFADHPAAPFPQVLPVTANVPLYDGERIVYRIPAGQVLDVLKSDGDWQWVGRGWLRASDGIAIDDAEAFFSRRIIKQPTAFDLVSRARAKMQTSEFSGAWIDCDHALRLDPRDASALTMRGRCAVELGDKLAASVDMGAAIRLNRQSAVAYTYRGILYLKHDELALALRDLDRAIELDPHSVPALAARGRVYAALDQPLAANADFAKALEIHPSYTPVYNSRANLALSLGHFEQAIADYSAAIELAPHEAQLHLNRALAHERLQQSTAAIRDADEAIRLQPTATAYQVRARLRLAAGQIDAASQDRRMAESLVARADLST